MLFECSVRSNHTSFLHVAFLPLFEISGPCRTWFFRRVRIILGTMSSKIRRHIKRATIAPGLVET